jgi:hypothetical protein
MALVSVSALIAGGALAIPASAQASAVGPKQYFYGQVFGPASSSATQAVIGVACTTAETAGHPLPGQSVEVEQAYPPVTTTLGYTGNFATGIDASLIWSRGTISVLVPVATLTSYGVKAAIPTSVTVPCSGSGVMSFAPSPDPDNSGTASDVSVTFVSTGA